MLLTKCLFCCCFFGWLLFSLSSTFSNYIDTSKHNSTSTYLWDLMIIHLFAYSKNFYWMPLNGRCYFRLNGRVGSGPQITQFLPLLSLYSGGKCLWTSKHIYKKRKFHLGTSAIKGNKKLRQLLCKCSSLQRRRYLSWNVKDKNETNLCWTGGEEGSKWREQHLQSPRIMYLVLWNVKPGMVGIWLGRRQKWEWEQR